MVVNSLSITKSESNPSYQVLLGNTSKEIYFLLLLQIHTLEMMK